MVTSKHKLTIIFLFLLPTAFHTSRAQDVEAALANAANFDFEDTQLDTAVAHLSQRFRIPIFIDNRSLQSAKIHLSDKRISLEGTRAPLETALNRMLEPLQLAWFVRHDALWITTAPAAASQFFETRVYKITRRVPPDRRLRSITQNIAPESWSIVGGKADAAPLPPKLIVIYHAPARHRQIAQAFSKSISPIHPKQLFDSKHASVIEKQLAQPTEINFKSMTFGEAVRQLAQRHQIKLTIDEDPFSEEPIPTEKPITLQIGKVRHLESGLSLLLKRAGTNLTWVVDNDEIRVTTVKSAASKLIRWTYDVKSFATTGDVKLLMEAIEYTIAPSTWQFAGGNATMELDERGTKLVISQSQPVHRELRRFFAAIHAAHPTN